MGDKTKTYFETLVEREGGLSSGFGRWWRDTTWPIVIGCQDCGKAVKLVIEDFNKNKVDFSETRISSGPLGSLRLIFECPHCENKRRHSIVSWGENSSRSRPTVKSEAKRPVAVAEAKSE